MVWGTQKHKELTWESKRFLIEFILYIPEDFHEGQKMLGIYLLILGIICPSFS